MDMILKIKFNLKKFFMVVGDERIFIETVNFVLHSLDEVFEKEMLLGFFESFKGSVNTVRLHMLIEKYKANVSLD